MSDDRQPGSGADKDIPPWLQPIPEDEGDTEGFFAGKKTLLITAGAAISVVVLFVVAILYLYDGASDEAPRHIVADTTPVREKPEEPGGMDVPYQDKQVFDQGASTASDSVKLSDQPEEPLRELPAEPEPEEDMAVVDQSANGMPQSAPEQVEMPVAVTPKAPEPVIVETQKPVAHEPAQAPAGTYKVQLGAYGSEESAEKAWKVIRGKYRSILEGLSPLYEAVRSGDRTLYRLRVGPLESRAAADEVCLGLRAQQQACIVVNP